ncbi:uncharacterized protein BKA55DRAFT_386454 [Fusarium redolens]|uniref:Uncharacterized protein n=1 Tax=Fusarium redolens TaxID=48865 RepID=A0A9P9K5L3_FUSRE|nr:uncharacterized protein BKA55DRAFT_386454 [Fusarium redolens]KAH7248803.1 hypothetical protein BKA55DRAFT_386454 [Fusarium redolens]
MSQTLIFVPWARDICTDLSGSLHIPTGQELGLDLSGVRELCRVLRDCHDSMIDTTQNSIFMVFDETPRTSLRSHLYDPYLSPHSFEPYQIVLFIHQAVYHMTNCLVFLLQFALISDIILSHTFGCTFSLLALFKTALMVGFTVLSFVLLCSDGSLQAMMNYLHCQHRNTN